MDFWSVKYRGSEYRDCSINLKLNLKFSVVFQNLKNYDFQFITQELDKFNFEIDNTSNGLEK